MRESNEPCNKWAQKSHQLFNQNHSKAVAMLQRTFHLHNVLVDKETSISFVRGNRDWFANHCIIVLEWPANLPTAQTLDLIIISVICFLPSKNELYTAFFSSNNYRQPSVNFLIISNLLLLYLIYILDVYPGLLNMEIYYIMATSPCGPVTLNIFSLPS